MERRAIKSDSISLHTPVTHTSNGNVWNGLRVLEEFYGPHVKVLRHKYNACEVRVKKEVGLGRGL